MPGSPPRCSRPIRELCAFAQQGPLPAVADSTGGLTAIVDYLISIEARTKQDIGCLLPS